jgi:hypothetical protein
VDSNIVPESHADFDGSSEVMLPKHAAYYRAAATRARMLAAEATTPRIKQPLQERIDLYEQLACGLEEREPGIG